MVTREEGGGEEEDKMMASDGQRRQLVLQPPQACISPVFSRVPALETCPQLFMF